MIIFKKEKEVIELILKHADKMAQCLSTTALTLQAYLNDRLSDAKTLSHQVDGLESEADIIRHEIKDKLFSGAYMPMIREDIYRLVESIDTVANAAEKCCDFFLNQRPAIPDGLKNQFRETVRESLSVGKMLEDAVQCYFKGVCPIEVSRHHSKDIGVKESEVDRIEWDLTKEIFTSDMDFAHKIHLKRCLSRIAEISDLAEDAADQMDLVILKSMF
jgi:predicted phosphate transport protein (TIGR00153 family)